MAKIKVMNENLSNKIAAGEVVEKCVSIVKELVENSIDAKSTEIKIELKESGLREIRVVDNGIGMDEEDAVLAFGRHATSKLINDDDLFNIDTLGFRGEALPSIASVSEIELKTCNAEVGTFIHIKGGHIIEKGSSDARIGTSITVSNLFYNTPARLKHLGSVYSELANVVEYVNKIALSYPNIKVVLINDGKEIFNTDGSGNQLKVIRAIYGTDVAKKMLFFGGENDDYEIEGYMSLPEVTRSSRNYITTIINGRVIKNSEINKTVNEAYHTFKEDTRYPIVVLNINTDPSLIDVNIHPSKMDIKFSNFSELKELITTTMRSELKKKLLIPNIETKRNENHNTYENISFNLEREIKEEDNSYLTSLSNAINMKEETSPIELEEELTNTIEVEKEKLPELYPVGLALGTYIICQNEKGIYLIDQHAAKERINYEKYSYFLSHPNNNVMELLVPINIELPMNESIILKENIEFLKGLNIEIESFGQSSFLVKSHPTWFPTGNEENVIRKIIELVVAKEKNFSLEKFNDRLAMTVSCKMSIKANTDISIEEMENLISDLRKCDNPFHCPHGRPTIIHYSIYELEKLFKRSI